MPTVIFPDGGHDGGGLARFDDGHDLIGLGTSEVAFHQVIAPAWGIFFNGYTPFLGAVLDPVVVLRSDVAQHLPTDGIDLAIGPEKADGPLFLLKGLDRGMEQDTIEATIIETDVILMVFVEGVHGVLQRVSSLEESRYYLILAKDLGYGDTSSLTTSLEEVSRLLNAYASAILASDS